LRKYKSKCNAWLGLGTFTRSPNLVDYIIYLNESWTFDEGLEAECNSFFSPANPRHRLSNETIQMLAGTNPVLAKAGKNIKILWH
jgi:hypothetical protein